LRGLYGGPASLVLANGASGGAVATLRVPYHEALLEAEVA
jgi:hypothetical protein